MAAYPDLSELADSLPINIQALLISFPGSQNLGVYGDNNPEARLLVRMDNFKRDRQFKLK